MAKIRLDATFIMDICMSDFMGCVERFNCDFDMDNEIDVFLDSVPNREASLRSVFISAMVNVISKELDIDLDAIITQHREIQKLTTQ